MFVQIEHVSLLFLCIVSFGKEFSLKRFSVLVLWNMRVLLFSSAEKTRLTNTFVVGGGGFSCYGQAFSRDTCFEHLAEHVAGASVARGKTNQVIY